MRASMTARQPYPLLSYALSLIGGITIGSQAVNLTRK